MYLMSSWCISVKQSKDKETTLRVKVCPNLWLVVSMKWHSPQSEQSWRRRDYLLTISPGRPGTARAKGSSGRSRSHRRKCKSCLTKRLWLIDTTRGGGHSLTAPAFVGHRGKSWRSWTTGRAWGAWTNGGWNDLVCLFNLVKHQTVQWW